MDHFASDVATNPPEMARTDFSRFIEPRGVAVIGASSDLTRIGGQPLRLLTEYGYHGQVYPVNPKYPEIHGLKCYASAAVVPQPCDIAIVALSAKHVAAAIADIGMGGIPFAIVFSAGFSEVGAEGHALQQDMLAAARRHHVRVIGPNCLGAMNLNAGMRAGFGGTMQLNTLKPGPLALVTQSGGFGFGIAAISSYYNVGMSHVVSTGNEADVNALELMEAYLERDDVQILVAFLEGIQDGRRLLALGRRALALGKPILTWKVGNSVVGRRAMTSHTARMTSSYELYQTAFREGGFIEVHDNDDLIDVAKAFLPRKLPQSNRAAIVTLSGGSGVLMADHAERNGIALPTLAEATVKRLKEIMVDFASAANPIDATANGYNDDFASYNDVIRTALADPNVDSVITRSPRGKALPVWSKGLVETAQASAKPLLINWPTSPDDNRESMQYLEANGVPCILAPGRTVHALGALAEFAGKQRRYTSAPPPAARVIERQSIAWPNAGALGEHASKRVLASYGILVVAEQLLTLQAVEALNAAPFAWPVAVKVESPDVPHKTEAGAVRLGIDSLAALKTAARTVVENAQRYRAGARIDGVLIQQMAHGQEVIVGAVNDVFFGPVITLGLGGILTELLHDVTHRFAPFDARIANEMIDELKAAPLFAGYRGRPALDRAALADTLVRVSLLIADHAERIAEIDINPVFVGNAGQGVVAADALLVVKDGEGATT